MDNQYCIIHISEYLLVSAVFKLTIRHLRILLYLRPTLKQYLFKTCRRLSVLHINMILIMKVCVYDKLALSNSYFLSQEFETLPL